MGTATLDYNAMMVLIWVSWSIAFAATIFHASFKWVLQRGRLSVDDYFIIAGVVSLAGLSSVITKVLPHFYLVGEYTKAALLDPTTPLPLPPDEFSARSVESLKLLFSQMLLFWTTLWAAKFSILFFIRRLVHGLPGYIRWWWACFATVLLLYLACMLSNFLTCTPLHRYWSPTGCSTPEDLRRADASIKFATGADVAADILTMILPLHLLRKLIISPAHKFGLAVIFTLGAIIIAVAFVRLIQVTKATGDAAQDPTNVANGPILLSMWSHIESSVAIIVATLPTFRFVIAKNRATLSKVSKKHSSPAVVVSDSRGRKWQNSRSRHHSNDEDWVLDNAKSSQTELRSLDSPVIHKDVEFRVQEARSEASPSARSRHRARDMLA